jgi:uncharacterized membrane protein YccC
MHLANFIESRMSALMNDWRAQAARLSVAAPQPDDSEIEDSARRLLEQIGAICDDLRPTRSAMQKALA